MIQNLIDLGYVVIVVGFIYLLYLARQCKYNEDETLTTDEIENKIEKLNYAIRFNYWWFLAVLFYVVITTVIVRLV